MSLDEEKLILLVSENPELYDLKNENYMNTVKKNNIWAEIAKQIGAKDNVCKEKWKSLRDSYHRNLKKRKSKSGDGAFKNKKWKYENQMEFLRPYFQERETRSNFEESAFVDDSCNESYTPDLTEMSPEVENSPQSSTSSALFKSISARKKRQTTQLSVAGVLQNYLDTRSATATQEPKEPSPIHSFFKAMADSVVALPLDLQLKAKNKIFATVSEIENENLLRNSTTPTAEAETVIEEDEAETVVEEEPETRYFVTSDGFLVPQDFTYDAE